MLLLPEINSNIISHLIFRYELNKYLYGSPLPRHGLNMRRATQCFDKLLEIQQNKNSLADFLVTRIGNIWQRSCYGSVIMRWQQMKQEEQCSSVKRKEFHGYFSL